MILGRVISSIFRLKPLLFVSVCGFFALSSISQTLVNGDLDGTPGISWLPTGWQHFPHTDPASTATTSSQATSDLAWTGGPDVANGINGNPFVGTRFTTGLHGSAPSSGWVWREGIQQSVTGFIPGDTYEIQLHQTVVKQINALDSSGSWSVMVDNILLMVTAPTTSTAVFNSNSLVWEARSVSFVATATTHLLKFFPTDDDNQISIVTFSAVRMGIDGISVTPLVSSPPQVDLGNDTTLCQGDSLVLDASYPGSSYVWQDGSTLPTFTVTSAGTYVVDVTNTAGTVSDTINVSFLNTPIVDLGADTLLCDNSTLTLDASQLTPMSYLWQDGNLSSSYNVTQAGIYSVTVDNMGCSSTDFINVSYETSPQVSLSVTDTTLCVGSVFNVSFSGSNISQVLWSDGSTAPFLTTSASTQYWIDASNSCGDDSDTLNVTFMDYPVIDFGSDTLLCNSSTLTLDASQSTPMSYLWQDGSVNPSYGVSLAGLYSVTIDNMGCSLAESINVSYEVSPQIALSVNDTTLCAGTNINVSYSGSGISQVLWSDGSTAPSLTTTTSTQYWIDASNVCGNDSDTLLVTFVDYPVVDLGADTTLCEGNTIILGGNQPPLVSFLWQDGSTNPTLDVVQAGVYSLVVSNSGCISTDDISINYTSIPEVSLPNDTSVCSNELFRIDIPAVESGSIAWSTGSTELFLIVPEAGVYTLEGFNNCGTSIDSIEVDFIDCDCSFYIPNTFTPNGDEFNRVFTTFYDCEDLHEYNLKIFNRWGEIVFESNDISDQWDGKYVGQMVQDGVYVYQLRYSNDRVTEIISGHVNVIR